MSTRQNLGFRLIEQRRRRTAVPYLVFSTQPGGATSGSAFSPQPVVTAKNPDGSTNTSFTGNVTLAVNTVTGSHALGGTVTVAAVAGVATFSGVTDTGSGDGTLTASATGYSSATSASFTTAAGGGSAPTLVQTQTKDGTAGTSVSSNAFAVTTGNTLHVSVLRNGASGITISVADNAGNTYTPAAAQQEDSNIGGFQTFVAKNITGHAALVITATFSSSVTGYLAIAEIAGANATTPLDTFAQSDTIITTTATSAAINTTSNVLVVFYGTPGSAAGPFTVTIGGAAPTTKVEDAASRFALATKSYAGAQTGLTASTTGNAPFTYLLAIASYKP